MSEYQFVHFLAIDRPLDERQLGFMEQQSSRAEITPLEFANEYQFGDFHGNAREMLRRGYDIHLHYANFGVRRLWIRLPAGLPCDRRTFNAFRVEHCLEWIADKKGHGGILEIEPEADAGTFEEDLFDIDELLPIIAPIRELLIGGDLRSLYLAWLACSYDDEAMEPPVPAGLGKLPPAMKAMAAFYELSDDVIAAAALCSPPAPKSTDAAQRLKDWIAKQGQNELRELVGRLLGGDAAATRSETLARIRDEAGAGAWPLAEPTRTLAQLRESATRLGDQRLEREKQAGDRARRKRLAAIAADPSKSIATVEELVKERSVRSYQEAARQLADLREALGPEIGPARARAAAEKLRRENPTLRGLIGAFRKQGLLK
jgi:hypothetical protein